MTTRRTRSSSSRCRPSLATFWSATCGGRSDGPEPFLDVPQRVAPKAVAVQSPPGVLPVLPQQALKRPHAGPHAATRPIGRANAVSQQDLVGDEVYAMAECDSQPEVDILKAH